MPYDEVYRPQFHFSAAKGFLGDPVMMVHYAGEYHLGYLGTETLDQTTPAYWGHAVSPDLLHWRELPVAVQPDPGHEHGIWSGGAVVDGKNTSGLQTGAENVLVAFYTKTHHGICLVYSNDRGRTWTKYAGNPVLSVAVTGTWDDRDPTVFWHEATGRWVMLLTETGQTRISFYGSADLKNWERLSTLNGFRVDCPDLLDLPVDGDPTHRRWVLWASFFHPFTGRYMIGDFDGTRFVPETDAYRLDWGRNSFAARTWRDVADGRTVQIAFLHGPEGRLPDMPFSQQMGIPRELSLRTCPDGLRLCAWPVREVETLRTERQGWNDVMVGPNTSLALADSPSGLVDLEAEFELRDAAEFGLRVRGEPIGYNVLDRLLQVRGASGPLEPADGRIGLRILADRMSLEVFGNGGRLLMTNYFAPAPDRHGIEVYALQGSVRLIALTMHELRSTWRDCPVCCRSG